MSEVITISGTFTAIPTEVNDALCCIRIPGEPHLVLYAIMRKTFGFNKEEDWIAISQLAELTGLPESSVCRAANKLRSMNVIGKRMVNGKPHYSVNRDVRSWKPLPKVPRGNKKVKGHLQKSK
ncbi:MAG: replication protein [Candidatus Peribacter sp.]|jgi:phage replication O-like protein O